MMNSLRTGKWMKKWPSRNSWFSHENSMVDLSIVLGNSLPEGICNCNILMALLYVVSLPAEGTCKALPNEALCKHPRKHGLITRVYLRQPVWTFDFCSCSTLCRVSFHIILWNFVSYRLEVVKPIVLAINPHFILTWKPHRRSPRNQATASSTFTSSKST